MRYGAFVNADGKMIDDGNVYKLADDKFWVMINTPDIEDWFPRRPTVSTRRWPTAPRTSG